MPRSRHHSQRCAGRRDVLLVPVVAQPGGLARVDAGQQATQDRPAVHDPYPGAGSRRQHPVGGALPQQVVVAEAQQEVDLAGGDGLAMEVVRAHAEADVTHQATRLETEQSGQRAIPGQGRLDPLWIVDQHAVEVIAVEQGELVFHVAHHAFGGIVGLAVAVAAPGGRGVTAQPAGDDHFIARNLLQRQAQLAQGVTVAAGAVEVVHPQRHGVLDQCHRVRVGDEAEVVAEALGAERDDRNGEPGLAEHPPGERRRGRLTHAGTPREAPSMHHFRQFRSRF